jgi:hypothetical protein
MQLANIRPTTAWVLSDRKNRVFFRPGCKVDFAEGHLRHANYKECEYGECGNQSHNLAPV